MSGSENGGHSNGQRVMNSPTRVLGGRSASPAKRRADDMEDAGSEGSQQTVPGSFPKVQDDGPSPFDEAMSGMTPAPAGAETQETVADSTATSADGTMTTNTSATSFQSSDSPTIGNDDDKWKKGSSNKNPLPSIDEQVRQVTQLTQTEDIDEGSIGFIISTRWLRRVLARTSEGLPKSEYPKDAREGPIGAVDNSDIVPDGAFRSQLQDTESNIFIPLKKGLTRGEDFEVFPAKAWELVTGWYGIVTGQQRIVRYVHNTADPPLQHLQYELDPPIFTIRKVPQPGHENDRPASPSTSLAKLGLKKDQRARGQESADDAIRFVSSRAERFQKFLHRSKLAAGIPLSTKVKIWRMLKPESVAVDGPDTAQAAVPSPPPSRSSSPNKATKSTDTKLVLPPAEFKGMEVGKHLEHIDAKDESNNDNYNGSATMNIYGLHDDQVILLEEQIGGPAGGEFQSDSKKTINKLSLGKKAGSKIGSAATSGRTSPAPGGGGVLTRGRARRDGRTRGTVGLTNLGNTCYMNSALQCIRSVEELAMYFLSGKYKPEINATNPLGHHGVMAKQYAGVLDGIYSSNATSSFTPREFKTALGRASPLFSGYGQQDSQEFLSFLVDALHEDLNRIKKKPYNENPDSDDKTVHDPQAIIELGETYRANHKARNDSVAMDLFSGFYKNTMECPVCEKISITFDPFSLVTLQLPIESTFQHTFTFVPLRGAPINHSIDMDKNATLKNVKENIASKHPGVTADRLWMAEVYSHKIYKVFDNQTTLAEANIQPNDYIFVYELPAAPTNLPEPSKSKAYTSWNYSSVDKDIPDMDSPKAERFAVPIFSRQKGRYGNSWEMLMHPLYILVTREEAQDSDVILKKILLAVAQQTDRPILTEMDTDKGDNAKPTANGDVEHGEFTGEDAARVSDHSVPSEDGYVDVSIDNAETTDLPDAEQTAQPTRPVNAVPARFMDSQYFLSPALRNHLFAVNFAKSSDGMHCASMSSFDDKTVRNMCDRVKLPRRGSIGSSASEQSSTSTGSGPANAETEESDADDDESKPDIVLGHEDALHVSTPTTDGPESDDELPADPLTDFKTGGRRQQSGKPNKFSKGNKNGKGRKRDKTYSRRDKQDRRQRPGSRNSTQSQRSKNGKPLVDDENPYYIKLGEAIVLDWHPEGLDSLFGGEDAADELRGHWLSTAEGKGLAYVPDRVLEAKQKQRLARKKHGVTLEDCFAETGKREILSEDNAWYCSRCKEMRQAAKTLEIWTMPDILIVHLKRFGGNRSFRDKIDVLVDYPIEGLNMVEKVGLKEDGKEYMYDLFAVDNHYGGLGGGHYTAMAKNFYDGQWYDYNDSSCSKTGGDRLHSAAAYLLFYRRRSDKPLGPEYLQDIVNEMRNPAETEDAEDAEGSDSGEGKLGGPTSSLHGSSSALVAAGAGMTGSNRSLGGGGQVAGVGSNLTQRRMSLSEELDGTLGTLDGKPILGPERPPHLMQYGTQGSSWSFDAIDQPVEADPSATETLLGTIEREDDNDSNVAEVDSGFGGDMDYSSRLRNDFNDEDDDIEELPSYHSGPYTGAGTPEEGANFSDNFIDDHSLYSDAHEHHGALHIEHGVEATSPPADEIHLADDDINMEEATAHDKMD